MEQNFLLLVEEFVVASSVRLRIFEPGEVEMDWKQVYRGHGTLFLLFSLSVYYQSCCLCHFFLDRYPQISYRTVDFYPLALPSG